MQKIFDNDFKSWAVSLSFRQSIFLLLGFNSEYIYVPNTVLLRTYVSLIILPLICIFYPYCIPYVRRFYASYVSLEAKIEADDVDVRFAISSIDDVHHVVVAL